MHDKFRKEVPMTNKEKFEAGEHFTLKGESKSMIYKFQPAISDSEIDCDTLSERFKWDKDFKHCCNVEVRQNIIYCYMKFLNSLAKVNIRYEHLEFIEQPATDKGFEQFKNIINDALPRLNEEFDHIIREHNEKDKT